MTQARRMTKWRTVWHAFTDILETAYSRKLQYVLTANTTLQLQ